MESILSRNIKFWTKYFLTNTLMVLGMMVGITAFLSILSSDSFITEFINTIPMYLIMASILIVMVYGFTSLSIFVPMGVSFGSRRSTSVIAMSVVEHIIVFIAFAISIGSLIFANQELAPTFGTLSIIIVAAIMLLMCFGNLVALLSNRFGRVAGMIVYIVIVLVLSIGGSLLVTLADLSVVLSVFMISPIMIGTTAFVIATALDVLTVFGMVRSVAKKELSFE